MPLPPASAAIFTSYLFHSISQAGSRKHRIRRQPAPAARRIAASLDAEVAAIVDAPPLVGETARFAATRQEAELVALFATLTVAESRVLRARLIVPKTDDPIAARFARLPRETQRRLADFLAEARCRQPDPSLP